MKMDDEQLVQRTLLGSGSTFGELVERYRDAVCAIAYSHLGDFDDVQDAAQEAFVQAYTHLSQLREPGKFGPWIRRITTNVCTDILRRRGAPTVPLDDALAVPTNSDDPDKTAVRMAVRDALFRLPENARTTLALFHIDGYSHGEIADLMDVPINTVRSRLRSARKQLSKEMISMFTDVLGESKRRIRIANEYVLYRDDLLEEASTEDVNDFLYMVVNVVRIVTQDRVRSVFVTGDYTCAKVKPESRLDLNIFMKDEIDTNQDDMRRVWSVVMHLATYAGVRLGGIGLSTAELYMLPSVLIPEIGRYLPGSGQKDAVKNHSLLLWGEDIRPLIVLDEAQSS